MLVAALVAIGAVVLALVLAAALSGPRPQNAVHVEPQVTFALPPPATGCRGVTPAPGGGESVPLTVSVVAGQVAETADVCIGGLGPYPFVLDSGAGQSTIDAGLAHRLHLASAGPASEFAGVGCTGAAQPVSVGEWSLDGVPLSSQQLTAATLPQMGGKGEPDGLLGSDVLSRSGESASTSMPGPSSSPAPRARRSPIRALHRPDGPIAQRAAAGEERHDGAAHRDRGTG